MKPKIMLSYYNNAHIGGPNNAMRRLENSFLKEKYHFVPLKLDKHLGKVIRINVLKELVQKIRKEKPDVIYFTGMQLHGFYIALAAYLAGYHKRTIMVVRGSTCDAIGIGFFYKNIFYRFIEPLTVKMSYITHTVCEEMANNPIIKNNVNIFGGVINNAAPEINTDDYCKGNIRKEVQALKEDILFVYTGRVVQDKGLKYLFDAFVGMPSNCKLLIVGDGEIDFFENYIYKLKIESNVFFLGRRNDIFDILSDCDVFVFPTLHENLSNSILEACTFSLPVIATNVGGNPEIIRNEIDGILVEPFNSIQLRSAMVKMSDENIRLKYGTNARQRMKDKFSAKHIYTQIDRLFEEILK